jgi:Flp pilus assembly protein TadD
MVRTKVERTALQNASNKSPVLDETLQHAIGLYRAGRVADAAALLRSASSQHPDSARLWGYLGFLQKESGSLAAAVKSFQKATRLAPGSEKASLGLFFTLWRCGRSHDAFNEMIRYIRFGQPKEYLDLLQRLLMDNRARVQSEVLVLASTRARPKRRAS